ncbi:unnamed protein product [Calypogeia fissa]
MATIYNGALPSAWKLFVWSPPSRYSSERFRALSPLDCSNLILLCSLSLRFCFLETLEPGRDFYGRA